MRGLWKEYRQKATLVAKIGGEYTLVAKARERVAEAWTAAGEHERAAIFYRQAADMWTAAGEHEEANATGKCSMDARTRGAP